MNLHNIQALIFDYGGTLDTDGRHWANVLWEAYQNAGVPILRDDFRQAYVHGERTLAKSPIINKTDDFRIVLLKKIGIQLQHLSENQLWNPSPEVADKALQYIATYCYDYALSHIEKSRHVLHLLSQNYPLVLVSNFYGNINAILQDFGLSSYFRQVIESSVVGVRKPDPAIFRLGIDHLNLPPNEIAVVGDSYTKDIVPAKSLGCYTIWIKGEGWDAKDNEGGHAADFQIAHIEDVVPLLQKGETP